MRTDAQAVSGVCEHCGEPFTGKGHGFGRYCSHRHQTAAYMRAQRAADPVAAREKMRAYRADPARATRQRESNRASQARKRKAAKVGGEPVADPVKRRARQAVTRAVRSGRLTPEGCLFCGVEPAQGHHHDYAQPLAVTWLCPRHHGLIHIEAGAT